MASTFNFAVCLSQVERKELNVEKSFGGWIERVYEAIRRSQCSVVDVTEEMNRLQRQESSDPRRFPEVTCNRNRPTDTSWREDTSCEYLGLALAGYIRGMHYNVVPCGYSLRFSTEECACRGKVYGIGASRQC